MRTIPIPDELVAALRRQWEIQELERAMAGAAWLGHDLVFARLDGGPVDPGDDYDDWKELAAAAGVPAARVHDGRHFAGTLMLAQGVNLRVVQEILGHSDVRVTQGYTHVASEMARDATQRMGSRLLGKRDAP